MNQINVIEQHPSVQRVRDVLAAHGLVDRIVVLPDSARTAQAAADALRCAVACIVNSLVFRLDLSHRPLLVLSSGARRVDVERLAHHTGETAAKASPDFVREQTGFVIGGVAPVGHVQPLTTLIEGTVMTFDTLWAAAGHPHAVFRLTPQELVRITAARVVDVAQSNA